MQINFPRLPIGVGLDEVALIVDVEAVLSYVVFQIRDETLKIDHCHQLQPAMFSRGSVARARVGGIGAGLWFTAAVDDVVLLSVLHEAVDAIVVALRDHDDWGLSGGRDGQYVSDLVADKAVLTVFKRHGIQVLSEESGLVGEGDGSLIAVVDPLDGSTNASRPLPWFATSLCVVDDAGARAAVVHDHPAGVRYDALRGGGARLDGALLPCREPVELADAIVGVNGLPPRNPGWAQYRALGAAALDLCAVADGRLDAYVDYDHEAHGSWDYLGGMLVCQEVGVTVGDAFGRNLVTTEHAARRTPVAAVGALFDDLVAARRDVS